MECCHYWFGRLLILFNFMDVLLEKPQNMSIFIKYLHFNHNVHTVSGVKFRVICKTGNKIKGQVKCNPGKQHRLYIFLKCFPFKLLHYLNWSQKGARIWPGRLEYGIIKLYRHTCFILQLGPFLYSKAQSSTNKSIDWYSSSSTYITKQWNTPQNRNIKQCN